MSAMSAMSMVLLAAISFHAVCGGQPKVCPAVGCIMAHPKDARWALFDAGAGCRSTCPTGDKDHRHRQAACRQGKVTMPVPTTPITPTTPLVPPAPPPHRPQVPCCVKPVDAKLCDGHARFKVKASPANGAAVAISRDRGSGGGGQSVERSAAATTTSVAVAKNRIRAWAWRLQRRVVLGVIIATKRRSAHRCRTECGARVHQRDRPPVGRTRGNEDNWPSHPTLFFGANAPPEAERNLRGGASPTRKREGGCTIKLLAVLR